MLLRPNFPRSSVEVEPRLTSRYLFRPSVRYHKASVEPLGLISSLTPTILLIPIAPLTAATTGGLICSSAGLSAWLQVPIIIYSWWLLGAGLCLAGMFYVLYLVRMMTRSVVPYNQAPTTVIVIGPLGQAATAFLLLGTVVSKGAFAQYSRGMFLTAATQESIFSMSVMAAVLLQGFSLFWGLFTIIEFVEAIVHNRQQTGKYLHDYTLSWWSLVLPICKTPALLFTATILGLCTDYCAVYSGQCHRPDPTGDRDGLPLLPHALDDRPVHHAHFLVWERDHDPERHHLGHNIRAHWRMDQTPSAALARETNTAGAQSLE
jgi:hypothetical protein